MTEPSAWTHQRTLVLADDAPLAPLTGHARRQGWELLADLPGGYDCTRTLQWEIVGDATVVYREAGALGVRLVAVLGVGAEPVRRIGAELAGLVPIVTEESLVDALLAEPPMEPVPTVRALHALAAHYTFRRGLGVAEPDPRYPRIAARLVAHPDLAVRLTALLSLSDLFAVRPEVAPPILARRGVEPELAELVEAIAELAAATLPV